MANTSGQKAQPKKSAPKARPLLVNEILTLCGDKFTAARLVEARDSLARLRMIFESAGGKVSAEEKKKFFEVVDEDRATRIIRKMSREVAASHVRPLLINA